MSEFDVVVIEDACRAIDVDGSVAATRVAFAEHAIRSVVTHDVV